MTQVFVSFFLLLALCSCNPRAEGEKQTKPLANKAGQPAKEVQNDRYAGFKLYYSYAGLGSGMGSMQPTFRATGASYIYTFQQNSYIGKPDKQPETKCRGILRNSSIDSIINLVKDIKDTLIYETNASIMSGGIHNVSVIYGKINITFKLHNASNKTARKIVDILNSNIPADQERLFLFNFPDQNP
jgi:hypothetical protein